MRHTAFVLTPLEEKIIAAYESGLTNPREIANAVGCAPTSAALYNARQKHKLQLLAEREKNQTHAPTSPSVAKGHGRIRKNRAPLANLTRVVCSLRTMQTAEHPDATATASERDRLFAELLDGPVQPGDVDAMIEALKGAVAVAKPTPEAVPSRAVPTENASEFPTSRESCKPSAGACAIVGTAVFF